MAWGIFFKMCAARSGFFLFISQYYCILFFIFSFPSPSSWLFQLASSLTTQNNSWYAMISLKSWRFDGKLKGRRKRRPRLLASREARIWKQLNLLPWMLAITLTKLTTVHLPSRILFVSLYWALRLGSPLFLDICSHYNRKLPYRKSACNLCRVYYEQIDQFRIALSLCFKARLSCSPTTFSIQIFLFFKKIQTVIKSHSWMMGAWHDNLSAPFRFSRLAPSWSTYSVG